MSYQDDNRGLKVEFDEDPAAWRERYAPLAAARMASSKEAEATLAALTEAYGGELPDPLPFRREHIRALVHSAFMAGCAYEAKRRGR